MFIKIGTTGQPVMLTANYFSLVAKAWCLYQYRLDFSPDIDSIFERKKLVRNQKTNINQEYIFDGTVMFTSKFIVSRDKDVSTLKDKFGC